MEPEDLALDEEENEPREEEATGEVEVVEEHAGKVAEEVTEEVSFPSLALLRSEDAVLRELLAVWRCVPRT